MTLSQLLFALNAHFLRKSAFSGCLSSVGYFLTKFQVGICPQGHTAERSKLSCNLKVQIYFQVTLQSPHLNLTSEKILGLAYLIPGDFKQHLVLKMRSFCVNCLKFPKFISQLFRPSHWDARQPKCSATATSFRALRTPSPTLAATSRSGNSKQVSFRFGASSGWLAISLQFADRAQS